MVITLFSSMNIDRFTIGKLTAIIKFIMETCDKVVNDADNHSITNSIYNDKSLPEFVTNNIKLY